MSTWEERETESGRYETAVRTVPDLDAQVRAWALSEIRAATSGVYFWTDEPDKKLLREHLQACPSTEVVATEWLPAMGYCETCYESAHLEVTVECEHQRKADVEVGWFSDLPDMLDRFEAWLAQSGDTT